MYGYMASDIWLRTILIVRKEIRCRHIGYSFRLAARVILYAPSHRQDSTYQGLCGTSRGTLDGTRNSSMGTHKRLQRIQDIAKIHMKLFHLKRLIHGSSPLNFDYRLLDFCVN